MEIPTGTEIVTVTATGIAMATHKDRETGVAETIAKVVAGIPVAVITMPKVKAEPQG